MPAFAKGQALALTTLQAETTSRASLDALLGSSVDGRLLVDHGELVDWRARATDYSGKVGAAKPGRWSHRLPESWWHSRLRSPELSISILQNALYVGDGILLTSRAERFEYSFPRYNRAPTEGAVVSKSLEGFHFARDIAIDRDVEGLSFVIGDLPGQFGHFVLEVFSRVWALTLLRDRFPKLRLNLVAFGGDLRPWQRELLELSDWSRHDIIVLSEPARLEAAVVASPAYVLHDAVSLKAAPAYATISRAVAAQGGREPWRQLYISRSRWPKLRRLEDELKVEQLFERRGFEVVHPQTLPVGEQIALVRSAKALCGPVGSALYLAAFQQPGASNFVIAPADFALPDDRMLAHLTGANLGYYFGSGGRRGAERSADWRIDMDGLAAGLDRWLAETASPHQGRTERHDDEQPFEPR